MCEYCDGSEKPIIDVDGDGFDVGEESKFSERMAKLGVVNEC